MTTLYNWPTTTTTTTAAAAAAAAAIITVIYSCISWSHVEIKFMKLIFKAKSRNISLGISNLKNEYSCIGQRQILPKSYLT